MKDSYKRCRFCSTMFVVDTKKRLYCTSSCQRNNRREQHRIRTRDAYRISAKTLEKWAKELEKAGYIVQPPKMAEFITPKAK